MIAPIAATLLSLALAQSGGGQGRPPQQQGGSPGTDAPGAAAPPVASGLEEPVPVGIPFMPTVGPPPRSTDGVFLDLGLLSEFRAQTIVFTDTSTVWGTFVEVTPGIAMEVGSPNFTFSLGYAPRLTVPFEVGGFELAVLNRATLRAAWRADPVWTVTALGLFIVGDFSQLNPASTPGGAGPPPPVLDPVRSFQTYPYVSIDTVLRVDGELSARSRIRLAGGYFDVGGTGEVGQANQPRTWGPQGEAAFEWNASRTAALTTTAAGQNYWMSGTEYFLIATMTESWRQSWSSEFDTTLAIGAGLSNRDVESTTAARHVVPVARATLSYRSESRHPLRLTADAGLGPYFDAYARIPYQRFTFGGTLDWRPSDDWQVGASLTAALVPYSVRVPESYGTGGLSASFAPVQFLILTAGGFYQAQLQGAPDGTEGFRQWSAYLSLALRDRLSL